ncbi:MAG: hypothetical protein IVW54_09365 [Candidatus Binataceae bacterium]|nr:hypothetical protein [Candidatus Binataceae bacterium]
MPTPEVPPSWVELLPIGEFAGRDGRGPFRVNDPAAVIAATRALRMEAGLPIDYDHATDLAAPTGGPAPAAGWIRELEVRAGSIWGQVEWTPNGAQAIRAHQYRYLSPVFQFSRSGEVMRLLRAGLTNNPNLYLTAICAANKKELDMEMLIDQLREILGLDDNVDAAQILEAVRNLAAAPNLPEDAAPLNEGAGDDDDDAESPDPARFVAMSHFQRAVTELNHLRAERGQERAELTVDDAIRAGKLVPAQRAWAVSYCQADFGGFKEFIARQPAMLPAAQHFASASAPRAKSESLTPGELAICTQLGLRPETFIQRRAARGQLLKLNKFFD